MEASSRSKPSRRLAAGQRSGYGGIFALQTFKEASRFKEAYDLESVTQAKTSPFPFPEGGELSRARVRGRAPARPRDGPDEGYLPTTKQWESDIWTTDFKVHQYTYRS